MRFWLFLLVSLALLGCTQQGDSPTLAGSQAARTLDDAISRMNSAQLGFIRARDGNALGPLVDELYASSSVLANAAGKLYSANPDSPSGKAYSNIARIAHLQASEANAFRVQLADGSLDLASARKKVAGIGLSLFTSVALSEEGKPQEFADAAGEKAVKVDSLTD